jgi:hypothetical protein
MKKITVLILLFSHSVFLFAKERVFDFDYGQTQISKYVSLEIKLTTVRYDKTLIPSYKLILLRKANVLIKELEFWVDYDYGQTHSYSDRTLFILDKEQLEEFNKSSKLILYSKKFDQIPRECNVVKKEVYVYTEPDGEEVYGIFIKLVIDEPD